MRVKALVDRVFTAAVTALAVLGALPVLHVVASTLAYGLRTMARAGPRFLVALSPPPGDGLGGIGPALLGTAMLAAVSTAVGAPVALALSLLAVEYPESPLSRAVRWVVKALMEIPTVLVGMLVYTLVVVPMGGFSALAGAVALAIVMLPYTTAYAESALEAVPRSVKEAGYAIGLKKAWVALRVSLGVARKGVALGVVMGLARAMGETAPLLFTVGGAREYYAHSLTQPADAVTLLIFQFAMTPYRNLVDVAWGAAAVLLLAYLVLFACVRAAFRGVRV